MFSLTLELHKCTSCCITEWK